SGLSSCETRNGRARCRLAGRRVPDVADGQVFRFRLSEGTRSICPDPEVRQVEPYVAQQDCTLELIRKWEDDYLDLAATVLGA
ncbi:MAG: hypothetical protein U5L04_00005, partial [Trueperaceae bacterium]|nr:hypothetical protein [Trueperaceae bacterium]